MAVGVLVAVDRVVSIDRWGVCVRIDVFMWHFAGVTRKNGTLAAVCEVCAEKSGV